MTTETHEVLPDSLAPTTILPLEPGEYEGLVWLDTEHLVTQYQQPELQRYFNTRIGVINISQLGIDAVELSPHPICEDQPYNLQALQPKLKEQYQIESLGVFGSYVRGEEHAESDLDVLVTFEETSGLLRFLKLENELSDTLGVKVDLVMRDALKPHIGKYILDEVVLI